MKNYTNLFWNKPILNNSLYGHFPPFKNDHFPPLMDSVRLPVVDSKIRLLVGRIITASALVEAILIKPKHI